METQEREYIDALIDVENSGSGGIYVSQETTRAIIADAWSGLEQELMDANGAFNASGNEPHKRALAILTALNQAVRYADVIYTLTPMPDEDIED